jgi:hypothetical protein
LRREGAGAEKVAKLRKGAVKLLKSLARVNLCAEGVNMCAAAEKARARALRT